MLDINYEALLARFTEMSKRVLGNNLTGIYLHGSAAMDCFNPKKSDLDLLLVVKRDIPDAVKLEFMEQVVKLNGEAPVKGIELSIVKKEVCDPIIYPTPFTLHFSVAHLNWFKENPNDYVENMKGTDKDLAAHFMIINRYGKVLFGDEIAEVFGEVSREAYLDSIRYDIEHACEDILEDPLYMTLNLCRVLAYLRAGLVLSKRSGGQWGMNGLPKKFHPLIGAALQCYETDEQMVIDREAAVRFAEYALAEIERGRAKHA